METTNNNEVFGPFAMPIAGESYMVGYADPKTGRRKAGASYMRVRIESVTAETIVGKRINQGDGRETIARDIHTFQTYSAAGFAKMLANGAAIDFTRFMFVEAAAKAAAKAAKKLANQIATLEASIEHFDRMITEIRESEAEGMRHCLASSLKWYESKLRSERRKLAKLLAQ